MTMKLYQVLVEGRDPVFLASRSPHRAAVAFVTFELDAGRPNPTFTVERIDNKLGPDQRAGLDDVLAKGSPGLLMCDPLFGWCVTPPS